MVLQMRTERQRPQLAIMLWMINLTADLPTDKAAWTSSHEQTVETQVHVLREEPRSQHRNTVPKYHKRAHKKMESTSGSQTSTYLAVV